MCPQVLVATPLQDDNNETAATNKENPSSYKGRRGRLGGTHTAKPWRIQGGPSIYGGPAGSSRV